MEFLQVWQAGATVNDAMGARLIVTVLLVELLPAEFLAVKVTV